MNTTPGVAVVLGALLVAGLGVGACGKEPPFPGGQGAAEVQPTGTPAADITRASPRALEFHEEARTRELLDAFLRGLEPRLLADRGPGHAKVGSTVLRWRTSGEGVHVVGTPTDPHDTHWESTDLITCLRLWMDLHGNGGWGLGAWMVNVKSSRTWRDLLRAAEEECEARDIHLRQEEVLQDAYALVSRDATGEPQWAVLMVIRTDNDVDIGTCNYEDPFDIASEAALTEAIVERALQGTPKETR